MLQLVCLKFTTALLMRKMFVRDVCSCQFHTKTLIDQNASVALFAFQGHQTLLCEQDGLLKDLGIRL